MAVNDFAKADNSTDFVLLDDSSSHLLLDSSKVPNAAGVWYPRLTLVVQSGTGINIYNLDTTNGGTDNFATGVTATHTQDAALRTFEPNVSNSTSADPESLQKKGWAIPGALFTPPESRCNALLPAGTCTLNATITGSRSAAPLADTTGWQLRYSLWRYNTTDNTGVFITSAGSANTTWGFLLNASQTKNFTISATISADVEFASNERLLMQVGCAMGTLGNPLSGTITYTFLYGIDGAAHHLDWDGGMHLQAACAEAQAPIGIGTAARTLVRVRSARTATGIGTAARTSLVRASRTATGIGTAARTVRVRAARVATGIGTAARTARVRATRTATGVGTASRNLVRVRTTKTATGIGTAASTRLQTLFREDTATGVGTASFSRSIIFVRSATATGVGTVTGRIGLPIDDLPAGGGTTVIHPIYIAED